jgi:Ca2+-binding RTX toxin-like protein
MTTLLIYGDYPNILITSQSFILPTISASTLFATNVNTELVGDIQNFTLQMTSPGLIQNLNYTFQSDSLMGGNGNDELYGDTENFSIFLKADDNPPIGSHGAVTLMNSTFKFGNDSLSGGNGDDILAGDTKNFSITLISGNNVIGTGVAGGTISDVRMTSDTFIFGNDSLDGGNGNDSLYGDVINYTNLLMGGSNGSFGATVNSIMTLSPVIFGDDTLQGGNGNDALYGDAGTVNITLQGGSNNSSTAIGSVTKSGVGTVFTTTANSSNTVFGSDSLDGGNGNDYLVGDVGSLTLNVLGGDNNSANTGGAASNVSNSSFYFGQDNLTGGNGDDTLIGDADNLLLHLKGGDDGSVLRAGVVFANSTQYIFGSDMLSGGNGDDALYGDVRAWTLDFHGGDNLTGIYNLPPSSSAQQQAGMALSAPGSDIIFGRDTLDGGAGNDTIVGDIGTYTFKMTAGDNIQNDGFESSVAQRGGGAAPSPITGVQPAAIIFGDDTITGGTGDDTLYGDVISLNFDLHGGSNAPGFNTGDMGGGAMINSQQIIFGTKISPTSGVAGDIIDGGSGNDTIFGEGNLLSVHAQGGTATGTTAGSYVDVRAGFYPFNVPGTGSFEFGNDSIMGGDGDDVIYGDWKTINIDLEDGTATGPGTLKVSADMNTTIMMGHDIINGGNGNDFLVGDVLNLNLIKNGVQAELTPSLVKVIWGNDTMTGGAGADTFEFTLIPHSNNTLQTQGEDTITDFKVSEGDKLQFSNVPDFATLNGHVSFDTTQNVGGGAANDTIVTFDGGGKITLHDVQITAFSAQNAILV